MKVCTELSDSQRKCRQRPKVPRQQLSAARWPDDSYRPALDTTVQTDNSASSLAVPSTGCMPKQSYMLFPSAWAVHLSIHTACLFSPVPLCMLHTLSCSIWATHLSVKWITDSKVIKSGDKTCVGRQREKGRERGTDNEKETQNSEGEKGRKRGDVEMGKEKTERDGMCAMETICPTSINDFILNKLLNSLFFLLNITFKVFITTWKQLLYMASALTPLIFFY